MITPFASIMQQITPHSVSSQIANVHTVFNVVTTILLLPFGKRLVKLSYCILPETKNKEKELSLQYLDFNVLSTDYHLATHTIIHTQLFNEIQNMLDVTVNNVKRSFDLILNYDDEMYQQLVKYEEYINYLNKEIISYTTGAISIGVVLEESESTGLFLRVSADLERIGDHAMDIARRAKVMFEQKTNFSDEALKEVEIMSSLSTKVLEELKVLNHEDLKEIVQKVDVIEESIDLTTNEFSNHQLKRLSNKECTIQNSVIFTKTLTDYERIGDHGLNIAVSFDKIKNILSTLTMIKE